MHQGSKYAKATQLKKPILKEEDFEKLIRDLSGDKEFVLGLRVGLNMEKSAVNAEEEMKTQVEKRRSA